MSRRNGFSRLSNDVVKLVKTNGEVYEEISANVQPGIIFIDDSELPIEERDKLVRVLPNKLIESYLVLDRGYYAGVGGISPHYQVKVKKESNIESKKTEALIQVFHMGDNSRVNNNSTDNSTNTVFNSTNTIFDEIKNALNEVSDAEEREMLKTLIDDLKSNNNKKEKNCQDKYKEFISLASAHIGIIAPFIPELTKQFL